MNAPEDESSGQPPHPRPAEVGRTDAGGADAGRGWTPISLGEGFPPPAGPYSPAVRAGPFLFISGQVPRDPRSGELAEGGVAGQARRVLENLRAALLAGGGSIEDVVQVTVYLADEQDWGAFNEVYREFFQPPYPTRTVVGARLRGILVELNAVAYLGD